MSSSKILDRPSGPDDSFNIAPGPLCCSAPASKSSMWSKISNALKSRSEAEPAPSVQPQLQPHLTSSIMGKILEQHPNLSIFNPTQDQTLPAPSPPSSPSKNGRLGLFKRSKSQHQDNTWSRKAKGSLHINTNMNGMLCLVLLHSR